MNQITRIEEMEQLYDHLNALLVEAEDAIENVLLHQTQFKKLKDYYTSPDWKNDYDDDCKGLIPSDIKRGVLSQDAINDLLDRASAITKRSGSI